MPPKGIINFYATLEVGEDADDDVIKKSYRKLVLKWHPDKNPSDRQKAEEQIRAINAAYSVLSNPTKREKYDLQRCAVDRKQRGMAPAKPRVSPKMSIPKEFMLQPMGHPEKFLRCEGKRTSIVGRLDIEAKFKEFFETAKFSLWWVPEVNNKCRIRSLGSKAKGDKRGVSAGLAGGLNLTFRVAADAESEVMLGAAEKGKRTENVDFMIKESPEYDGAYRFETACRRGHYLAFNPPCDLRVAPLLQEEQGRVLDFCLVDFAASVKYKDLDEVLRPLAEPKRGEWIPLAELREAKEVAAYFKKVMKLDEVWATEDFAAHFEGHFVDWDFKASSGEVRLRPAEERLGQVLRSSASTDDVSLTILGAGEELSKIPLAGLLRAVKVMQAAKAKAVAAKAKGKKDEGEPERLKLLRALPDALTAAVKAIEAETATVIGQVTIGEMLDGAEGLPSLVCDDPTPDLLEHRREATKLLVEVAVARLAKDEVLMGEPPKLTASELLRLLRLHGVAAHDVALSRLCAAALKGFDRPSLLQVVQRASVLGCETVAKAAAAVVLENLGSGTAEDVVAAVTTLARAGGPPAPLAAALLERGAGAAVASLVPAVLALCDRGVEPATAAKLLEPALADTAALAALPPEQLLGLALAAAKEQAALRAVFEPVAAAAAAAGLGAWATADVVRLLLASAKGRAALAPGARDALLAAAAAALGPRAGDAGDLSGTDLVKLLLGVAGFGPSALLDLAVKEAVVRLPDLSLAQVLLVTQGLAQGLQPDDDRLRQVLDFWPSRLKLASPTPAGPAPPPLAPDQVVKLIVAVAPALKCQPAAGRGKFVEAVCGLLLAYSQDVAEDNRGILRLELADGGALASFPRAGELLAALAKRPKRGRSPSPGAVHQSHLKSRSAPGKKKRRR